MKKKNVKMGNLIVKTDIGERIEYEIYCKGDIKEIVRFYKGCGFEYIPA